MTNKELGASGTVEPPASDHRKCEDLVVAYHNQSPEKIPAHLLFFRESLMHFVNYVYVWFHVVTESSWHAMSGVVQCTNSKQSNHTMPQVDDYKRLNTMENYKTFRTK